jgi:hypothetical protein
VVYSFVVCFLLVFNPIATCTPSIAAKEAISFVREVRNQYSLTSFDIVLVGVAAHGLRNPTITLSYRERVTSLVVLGEFTLRRYYKEKKRWRPPPKYLS